MNNIDIWKAVLNELQLQMTQATFDTWLRHSTLLKVEAPESPAAATRYTIGVDTAYAKDWLETRLYRTIQRTLARLTNQPAKPEFTIVYPGTEPGPATGPAGPGPGRTDGAGGLRPRPSPSESDCDPNSPPDCRINVELVNFDPTTAGWVMLANYAIHYWQPYLGITAFALWIALRSFPAAWAGGRVSEWPSIQTLADIVANHNRHRILGRAECKGRRRTIGALEVLENERIVYTRAYGNGPKTIYTFRVLDHLPLLTPQQVNKLTHRLQKRHQHDIARCQLDFEEWEQLTLPTLLNDTPMSQT